MTQTVIKTLQDLCQFLELDFNALQDQLDVSPSFPVKVPLHFASRIEKNNPADPLLKQVLPSLTETETLAGFSNDPVGDLLKNPSPSLIHKYHGRALLITSPRCDIHCRYCFRKHFPYQQAKQQNWQQALQSISQDDSIEELILSGGDPLTLSEPSLVSLIKQIEQIPHIQTLRFHSRTPVVAPQDWPSLWQTLQESRLQSILVIHCNHPNELSDDTNNHFQKWQQTGTQLLNQSVLLNEINDDSDILISLSKKLFQQGVLPYYLHLLDKVAGAHHFEVAEKQAVQLIETMQKQLPGYLVPKLVREISGETSKTPVLGV